MQELTDIHGRPASGMSVDVNEYTEPGSSTGGSLHEEEIMEHIAHCLQ